MPDNTVELSMKKNDNSSKKEKINRAQGCLLGQLAGDALGSLVEFQTPAQIINRYPDGVRLLSDGGIFNTIAGQPTDDSEMALGLARFLVRTGSYDAESVRKIYRDWLDSGPFDCGGTISTGLRGKLDPVSQANGAMMRISPLGIWGANYELDKVAEWAEQDALLTHPHPVCVQANILYTKAIAHAVQSGVQAINLYRQILAWAKESGVDANLLQSIKNAEDQPVSDFVHHQGWVLIAFQNALWQLVHAENLEEAVIATVMGGGDTDTNAAICGALLGAVYGKDAIPEQWLNTIQNCRPEKGLPGVYRPRPECYWPMDALELAEKLLLPR